MTQPQRIPLTREGFDKLKKELDHLKSVERPRIVREIEEARAHGDLSENAEYHAAKEKQSHIAGRINELDDKLGKAEIIDPTQVKDKDRVSFGAHVTLLEVDTETKVTYQVVGEYESDITVGKISMSSPIGKALIGKFYQDEVKVTTPKGIKEFEIVKVQYK